MRGACLLLFVPPSRCWLSIAQARHGAQIDDIAASTKGLSSTSAFRSLGWIWTSPLDPLDASDGGLDYDDDGWEDWEGNWHYFPNWREDEAQTDPWDADSDDDGMSDGYEADN